MASFAVPSQFLREHPGTALSLAYLALVIIGATYEFFLFREFGANVFDYSEPTDFLLAPFRYPLTLLFPLASAIVAFLLRMFDRWLRGVWDWYRRFSERSEVQTRLGATGSSVLVAVVYFAYFAVAYADWTANAIKGGAGRAVRIIPTASDNLPPLPVDGASLDRGAGLLVGTSARFVFIYRAADRKLVAIPNDAIGSLVIDAPPPRVDD